MTLRDNPSANQDHAGALRSRPDPNLSTSVAVAREEAFAQVAGDLGRQAEELARERGINMIFIAARGDPFAEICRVADEIHADALMVGASAKAGHRLVGSLAIRLVRAGRWPVTVVP